MKKIVFGLLVTMGMLNAQNNLVYNQTINLELNQGQEVVVPEGKTWKIEFINVEDPNGINSFNIGILNSSGQYNIHTVHTAANTIADAHLIWLKEGSKIIAVGDPVFVSALEFNIVPTSTGTGSGSGGGGVSSEGLVFSQIINEVIVMARTGNSGTILYSFNIPAGHIWKIRELNHRYWNENYTDFQDALAQGYIKISVNGEPFIYQNPFAISTSSYETYLKEGSYEITWYSSINSGHFSGNRIFLQAIEYRIP